jgi:hemerythrin
MTCPGSSDPKEIEQAHTDRGVADPIPPAEVSSTAPSGPEETSMIAWKPSLAVGVAEIDSQHQELFRRAGLFIQGLESQSRQDVGILLSFLRLYVVAHFGAEEACMRDTGYPAASHHQKQHDGFVKDLLLLSEQNEKARGPGIQPARVASWLEKWLINHVTEIDTDLARWLRQRGVPASLQLEPPDSGEQAQHG